MTDSAPESGRSKVRRTQSFDAQAGEFDHRAGIGDEVAARVAAAVFALAEIARGDALLEIGAGTGEIGRHLASGAATYMAVDASTGMLGSPTWRDRGLRVAADCDEGWPVAPSSVRCVFASRSAHLLDPTRLCEELERIRQEPFWFILGRTRRSEDGFKDQLRGQMRRSLVERGIKPREGRLKSRQLVDTMAAGGGQPFEPVEAAEWRTRGTCAEVLDAWRRKPGLGGATVDSDTREAVLGEVAAWARRKFGDLGRMLEFREVYTLSGVRWSDEAPTRGGIC